MLILPGLPHPGPKQRWLFTRFTPWQARCPRGAWRSRGWGIGFSCHRNNWGKLCPEANMDPGTCQADGPPPGSPADSQPLPLFRAGSAASQLTVLPHRGPQGDVPSSGPHLSHSSGPFCPVVRLGSGMAPPCSVELEAIHGLRRWGGGLRRPRATARGSNRSPGPAFCGRGSRQEGGTPEAFWGSVCRTHRQQLLSNCPPNGL